jgi:hypothetical protein
MTSGEPDTIILNTNDGIMLMQGANNMLQVDGTMVNIKANGERLYTDANTIDLGIITVPDGQAYNKVNVHNVSTSNYGLNIHAGVDDTHYCEISNVNGNGFTEKNYQGSSTTYGLIENSPGKTHFRTQAGDEYYGDYMQTYSSLTIVGYYTENDRTKLYMDPGNMTFRIDNSPNYAQIDCSTTSFNVVALSSSVGSVELHGTKTGWEFITLGTEMALSKDGTNFNITSSTGAIEYKGNELATRADLPPIPAAPTTAGTYTLQCVVDSSGAATYSWV